MSFDRRHEHIDIIQHSILSEEELSQMLALGRHFAGPTGLTHPGIQSITFATAVRDREKKKESKRANR